MNKEIKKKQRQLRKDLRGKYESIAKECGVSKSTVSNVLNGKHCNECVEKLALEIRKQVLAEREMDFQKKLKQLS